MTRIKICCIQDIHEARLAIEAGADAVGLVSEMPSGPGPIQEARIAEIAAAVPPPLGTFLLTSRQDPMAIIEQLRRCRTNTLQLVDRITVEGYACIREAVPGIKIVQVVHVTGEGSVSEAETAALHVDAILLDSGNPSLPMKELGGTGRIHDWRISRSIRDAVSIPVFLAGGLHAANVVEAIRAVEPFGVDVCTGVRTEGRLDPEKLAAFLRAARGERGLSI
jgi:phosphoribosylanthranilate isomerase